MTPEELGTLIRRARQRRRWTQLQFAERAGVSVRTVGDWERGAKAPRNRTVVEDVLGVSLNSEQEAQFVPADDDEARIWAMNEPEEWRRQLIAWKRASRSAG